MTNERKRAVEILTPLMSRIERLRKEPARAPRILDKIVAPVYRMVRWQPDFETECIEAVLECIREHTRVTEVPLGVRVKTRGYTRSLLASKISTRYFRALSELRGNLRKAELGVQVQGHMPAQYAVWLNHIAVVLRRIAPLLDAAVESWEFAQARAVTNLGVLSPIRPKSSAETASAHSDLARYTMIDALIHSASSETDRLDRRRRLLEAARQLLIESNASISAPMDGVKDRHSLIVRELTHIGRLDAAGILPSVSIVHQLREARQRGELDRLHAGIAGIEELSLHLENTKMGPIAHRGITRVWRGRDRHEGGRIKGSALRSVEEMYGSTVIGQLGDAVSRAKIAYSNRNASEKARNLDEETLGYVKNHLDALDTVMYVNGLLAVDGTFDVGGVLTPTRVVEEYKRMAAVRYPTSQLTLQAAEGPADIPDCIIEDPRTVLASLASGKLLARRFVHEETKKNYRTELQGELRIYLLDGSTSMLSRRAVMRDSILIAELCTLIERFNTLGRRINPTLYFQYFNTEVGPVVEVRTAAQAADAIASLLSTVQTGGTNIQAAILRSVEQIRSAARCSKELARANIVLITDGKSVIDEDEIVENLDSLGELQTAIHIIALGVENPSLCALARAQRLRGRRAFYQYVDEESIVDAVSGNNADVSLHPPKGIELQQCVGLLESTLDEIASVTRAKNAQDESDALIEKSLDEMDDDEALRAAMAGRIEVARRDQESLTRRFKRWFPECLSGDEPALYEPDHDTAIRLETVLSLLQGLIELGAVIDSEPSELKADTIEIFQRTLYDSGVTPLEYAQLIARFPKYFYEPMQNLYRVVGLTSETARP